MERVLMRLQTLRIDTHRQVDTHFKAKVQLEEQLKDNEIQLHFCRGVISALDEMDKIITEETDPASVPSKSASSAGLVHPGFDGEAMDKPKEKVLPPEPEDINRITNPEYEQPRGFSHISLREAAQ